MSRTHKTGRFRRERERLLDLAERLVGRRRHAPDIDRSEMAPLLGNADYTLPVPVMSGVRHGNQRRMRAALKVAGAAQPASRRQQDTRRRIAGNARLAQG